jgi:4-hydroxybenzoate polyprenyltransferase
MAKVTVRHNRLSRFSSVAMMLLGIVTLLFVNSPAGIALTAIGLVMYFFYRRGSRPPPGKRAAP